MRPSQNIPVDSTPAAEAVAWRAQWIWAEQALASPRNEWWRFRHTFTCERRFQRANDVLLHLTADSRHVVYLNGERLGWGPVRSWPERQSYDTHAVGHLLCRGTNTLAVLVQHWGVSTFYYRRGRGGLLAQLDAADGGQTLAATDDSWRVSRFPGQDTRAARMSVQQAYCEVIDGREYDGDWTQTGFADAAWPLAAVLGPVGMEPWPTLIPRDVARLREQAALPCAVLALRRVRLPEAVLVGDLGVHFVPEAQDDANSHSLSGLAATLLRTPVAQPVELGFPWGLNPQNAHLVVNGRLIDPKEFRVDTPQVWMKLELTAGDNEVLFDVTGSNRWPMNWTLIVRADTPVEFVSPLDGSTLTTGVSSPYAALGPFEKFVTIDHEGGFERHLELDNPGYQRARAARRFADWREFKHLLKPVSRGLTTGVSLLATAVSRTVLTTESVPLSLQRFTSAAVNPVVVTPTAEGACEITLDFGEQTSGFWRFTVEAEEGATLDFYGYEHEDQHGVQHTYHLENTLRYVCRHGRQSWHSPVRRGQRYLRFTVSGTTAPVIFHQLEIVQASYPVAEVGAFACSDDRLNRIWDIVRRTVRLCMEDTFVDCPAYEQTYWVGDAYNVGLINYRLFGATDIVKRCLRLVPPSKKLSPLLCDQVPSGWNSVIPNWTFFWVLACAEYLEATEDVEMLRELLPEIRATLEAYAGRVNRDDLLEISAWNLLDWAPMDQPNAGIVTHQNLFMVFALEKTAALAAWAKDSATERFALDLQRRMRRAINRRLWSAERQAYLDCIHTGGRKSEKFSLQTQVVALVCGVADKPRQARLLKLLNRPPKDFIRIGSPFMSFFLHWAWTEAGQGGRVIADTRRNWGVMLDHGATTCWEQFPGFAEGRPVTHFLTRSHTHAWSAAPGYFMSRTVLGVSRLDRGWRRVAVAPQPGDLEWARGRVPLPQGGWIEVEWRKPSAKRMMLTVKAPASVKIEATLPPGFKGKIEVVT